MRDFNQWLGDLTKDLQEEDRGVLRAQPEPCDLCGSAEEVCKCEELPLCGICGYPEDVCECEEEAAGFAFFCRPEPPGGMQGSITSPAEEMKGAHCRELLEKRVVTIERRIKPMEGCTVDEEDLRKISQDLHREIMDRQMAELRKAMGAPLEVMRETHNKTATEVRQAQEEANRRFRQSDHELTRYAVQFLHDMALRRRSRGGAE